MMLNAGGGIHRGWTHSAGAGQSIEMLVVVIIVASIGRFTVRRADIGFAYVRSLRQSYP